MARPALIAVALALAGAGFFVTTGSADPAGPPRSPLLGAAVAPDGTVLSVSCGDGKRIVVYGAPPRASAWEREVALPDLPADAKIEDVRVASFRWTTERHGLALGLSVRREGKPEIEYRYAVEVGHADAGWATSEPIFQDAGERWRIAEIRQNVADGDTLEILFARGFNSPRAGALPGGFEVRQFTDVCAFGGGVGIRGKDRVVSLGAGR